MRILVFMSKLVGMRCMEFLTSAYPDDVYDLVVNESDIAQAEALIANNLGSVRVLNAETIAVIDSEPEHTYDWLLNLWGSHIFQVATLKRARRSLNIHPALLPWGRGRDPVVWAIRFCHPAGVSLHEIDETVDTGAIWYQEEVPYSFPIRGRDLYDRVIDRCWRVFCEQWPTLRPGNVAPIPQSKDTHIFRRSELLQDREYNLDGDAAASEFVRRIMAHDFSEAYTARVTIEGKPFAARLDLRPIDQDGLDSTS